MLLIIWLVVIFVILVARRPRTRGPIGRLMPTNRLVDAVLYTRRGVKWGIPAMLLAAPYLLIAVMCRGFIEQGGPGWLNILVIYGIYNATKIAWIGPVSLIYLTRARFLEHRARKHTERQARDQDAEETPREYVAPQNELAMTGGAA